MSSGGGLTLAERVTAAFHGFGLPADLRFEFVSADDVVAIRAGLDHFDDALRQWGEREVVPAFTAFGAELRARVARAFGVPAVILLSSAERARLRRMHSAYRRKRRR